MKWEYRVLIEDNNYSLRKKLNRFGNKGWRLVDVVLKTYPNGDDVFFAYITRRKKRK